MAIKTIGIDADDTLWHNEHLFRSTEEHFVQILKNYADQELIKERLFNTVKANLAIYGYGIKGFTLSMIETALDLTSGNASSFVIKNILDAGQAMLACPVTVFDGVKETLLALRDNYHLVLISKGDLFDQERKLSQSGLEILFDEIEIVSNKSCDIYKKLFGRYTGAVENALMVGNSLKSDVIPALQAGAWAIHVPYKITWALEKAEEPINHRRYRKIKRLNDLLAVLQSLI